jgi:MipA family protein
MPFHSHFLLTIFFILSFSSALFAQDEDATPKEKDIKKWEVGLGLGGLSSPDYRGSDEYHSYASPIPYIIYRGKYIRSDRDGIRSYFFDSDRIEFTLSASGAFTPDTDENKLREGMPMLGSTLELGPSLNIKLSGENFLSGWQLQLPWRAVYAIDADDSGYFGSMFQPQLVYRKKYEKWTLGYRAGISIANNDYHDYYYSVAPEYQTETRSQFDAAGGYSGWHNQVSLTRNFIYNGIKTRLLFFVRYDNLKNTKMIDSPLVVTEDVWRGGLAYIWIIK